MAIIECSTPGQLDLSSLRAIGCVVFVTVEAPGPNRCADGEETAEGPPSLFLGLCRKCRVSFF